MLYGPSVPSQCVTVTVPFVMSEAVSSPSSQLKRTPLYWAHLELGARMVQFAGYEMPVQYPRGIIEEHAWTRNHAGLFDISHMGEAHLIAADARHETVGAALEALVPCDVLGLRPGQQRYTQLLNDGGGIIDDLMVTRFADRSEDGKLLLILNASRKEVDCAHIAELLPPGVHLEPKPDRALLALQGPNSASVLAGFAPQSAELRFLQAAPVFLSGIDCYISRSGYTGEDGFEISVPAAAVAQLWEALIRSNEVRPCGLGARDSLRLEAGLCLCGHELDETTSPIEAALAWSIQKRRRQDGGFPGASRIQREIEHGTTRLRAGILPEGRAPARENTDVLSPAGLTIGIVTSGGFSPTLKRPIAMGYIAPEHARIGSEIKLVVRGNALDARIVKLPFVPHAYARNLNA